MRYHMEEPANYRIHYGETYLCNHPLYNECTLFTIGNRGLAVIQQRFNPKTKSTYWTAIDPWLNDELYLNKNFKRFFDSRADEPSYSLYPTVSIRQIMWALRMKPLKRERWETSFDRRLV